MNKCCNFLKKYGQNVDYIYKKSYKLNRIFIKKYAYFLDVTVSCYMNIPGLNVTISGKPEILMYKKTTKNFSGGF